MSCGCNLTITKTIISGRDGVYVVEYGVGMFIDYKFGCQVAELSQVKLPGTPFCPHNVPQQYKALERFTVLFKCDMCNKVSLYDL